MKKTRAKAGHAREVALLTEQIRRLEQQLKDAEKELELQMWGLSKANEGVKLLYKELEKKNEELKALDRLKSHFISSVSHELRTPLTTMREAHAQILEGLKGPVTDAQRRFLTIAQNNVERLIRIINNLLDLTRLEAGKIKLDRQCLEVTALAREVIESLKPLAEQREMKLEDKLPPSLPETYVDADRIKQVLINLVGNSIKYSDRGSRISVLGSCQDTMIQIDVADTGTGIPEEYLGKVFDRFERAAKTPVPGVGGAGLGLAICKELIQMHKGTIWVKSKVGQGSTFSFTLPVCTEADVLHDYLAEQILEAERNQSFASLIMICIDDVAYVQENLGPEAIGQIRLQLKEVVLEHIRDSVDRVFEYGERELALVVVGAARENINAVKKRLEAATEACEFKVNDKPIQLSLTFKEAAYPGDAATAEEMVERINASD